MSKRRNSNYSDNANLIVDLFILIFYLMYVVFSQIWKGAKQYMDSKKEVDND